MCDLYDIIQQLSQKFIRKNKDLDYIKLAKDLEYILGSYGEIEFKEWNVELQPSGDLYATFTKKILELPEKIISGYGVEEIIDKHHFMMQIFRIPLQSPPTLYNLLLIAMYSGFLILTLRVNDFPDGIVATYKQMQMQSMINYIDLAEYNKIMQQMPDNIVKQVTDGLVKSLKE
jgi:hypothetical protein